MPAVNPDLLMPREAFERWLIDKLIHLKWPSAIDILGPEKCPNCGLNEYWSFTNQELKAITSENAYQSCMYVCAACHRTVGGVRDISQMLISQTNGAGRVEPE